MTMQVLGELVERLLVNVALEFDHRVERHPIVVPAPSVELGLLSRAQAHVAIASDEPQEKPALLLPPVVAAPFAAYPLRRNVIAQPVPRAPEYAHMLRDESPLFLQF